MSTAFIARDGRRKENTVQKCSRQLYTFNKRSPRDVDVRALGSFRGFGNRISISAILVLASVCEHSVQHTRKSAFSQGRQAEASARICVRRVIIHINNISQVSTSQTLLRWDELPDELHENVLHSRPNLLRSCSRQNHSTSESSVLGGEQIAEHL